MFVYGARNLVLIIMVLMIAGGCAQRGQEGGDTIRYEKDLAETESAKVAGLQPGSKLEKRLRALWIFTGYFPQK